jgi:hypothetical protein
MEDLAFPLDERAMKNALLALTLWTAGTAASLGAQPLELKSPDGNTVLQFAGRDFDGTPGCPVYRVLYQGRTVLADSRLGLEQPSTMRRGSRSAPSGAPFAITTGNSWWN